MITVTPDAARQIVVAARPVVDTVIDQSITLQNFEIIVITGGTADDLIEGAVLAGSPAMLAIAAQDAITLTF